MLLGVGAMVAAARGGDAGDPRRRDPRPAGNDPPLASVLPARAGGAGRSRRREIPHRDRPVAEGHVRHIQAPGRTDPVRRAQCRSLHAVASDAGRARRARSRRSPSASPHWDKKDSPELQLRHDLTRAKLVGFMERGDAVARRYPISDTQPAGALCPRDRGLPACRPARRHRADRRADRGAAEQSVFPRTQGPGAARRRQARRGHRAAAARDPARAAAGADPGDAGAGAERHRTIRKVAEEAVDAAAHRARPRAGIGRRLCAARHGLRPQGRSRPGRPRLGAGRLHARRRARPRASSRRAPRPVSRSARPAGCKADDIVSITSRPAGQRTAPDPERTTPCARSHASLSPPRLAVARRRRPDTRRAFSGAQRSEIEKIIREYLIAESRGAAGSDRRAGEEAGRRRGREASGRGQGQRRGDVQFAAPGHRRQSAGRRHLRRVLRLQLRLLQARHGRHDGPDEGTIPSSRSCSRSSRCSARARSRPRGSRSRSACRTRPARNISTSTRSCCRAAARSTRRARWRPPRRSASTWRGSRRTSAATRSRLTLEESLKLAEKLGLNGTPSYVIGPNVVVGAVGLEALKEKVNAARCGKATC